MFSIVPSAPIFLFQVDEGVWLSFSVLVFLAGLAVGSFLNGVVYRWPRGLSLWRPASYCPHCQHPLKWWANIPLLGFLCLRGHCAHCYGSIAWRYPVTELFTALWFLTCTWRFGAGLPTVAFCFLGCVLLVLAWIDWDHHLLPDSLTLPLLWSGLVVNSLGWLTAVSLQAAVWGAVVGYLSLWAVAKSFAYFAGKEGLGEGDFKLLAAIGAWLGVAALPNILLVASLLGLAMGGLLRWRWPERLGSNGSFPFGPALVAACLVQVLVA